MLLCGWVTEALALREGWTLTDAYRVVFAVYAVLGLFKLLLVLGMSANVEAEPNRLSSEAAPLLNSGDDDSQHRKAASRRFLPTISAKSRAVTVSLCLLFALDSFASGLAPL